uniref:Glycosyltransferase n=1 Tax=viral metagenome TaxID=1070528 RepID=A0A6C0IMD2_9ZZZZ
MNVIKLLKLQIIPLNIFQTWYTKDLPEHMRKRVELLKTQNPEFTYYLFDDNDCREFIKTNFDNDVLNAYDTLLPGAYKADLWRLCVLYIHGGIYMDIKLACVNNFKLIKLIYNNHYVKDRPINSIYNAFMVSSKNNNFLYKGIMQIVENVKEKYYGFDPLCPTGPIMLGALIKNNNLNVNVDLKHYILGGYIVYNNIKIISSCYPEYNTERTELYNSLNTKRYDKLWKERKIYI